MYIEHRLPSLPPTEMCVLAGEESDEAVSCEGCIGSSGSAYNEGGYRCAAQR